MGRDRLRAPARRRGCGLLYRSVERHRRRARPRRGPLAAGVRPAFREYDKLAGDIMRPLLRLPRHPLTLARFGLPTLLPGSAFARLFATEKGRALFGGVAAHAFRPLHYPLTSAIGPGIITAGHRWGWPVAAGGSGRSPPRWPRCWPTSAARSRPARGREASQLPPADVTLFDLAPDAVAGMLGDKLPARVARAFRRFRRAPGAFKVDFAVEGGVPWANPTRAGPAPCTWAAPTPRSPPPSGRSTPGGCRSGPLCWSASSTSPTRPVGREHPPGVQLRARAARLRRRRHRGDHHADRTVRPGFRDRIVGQASARPAVAAVNPNFAGGDIVSGAKDSASSSSALAPPCRRTGPACPACTSAPQRPRRVPGARHVRRERGPGSAALPAPAPVSQPRE